MRVTPDRSRALAVAALAVLAIGAAVPPPAPLSVRVSVALAGCALAALALQRPAPLSAVAVLAAAIEVAALTGLVWQLILPLALLAFAAATRRWPRLGPTHPSWGSVPTWETFVCGAITPGALVSWVLLARPDLSDLTRAIPDVPAPLLLVGAVAFVLLNALFEEWIWRGILQPRLACGFPTPVAVVLQAASFGAAHAHGFPRGVLGVALAGVWAVPLGLLRIRSGGVLAPFLAHVVADATIAGIVLLWLR